MLLKRHEFSHESEVRLIYIEERNLPSQNIVKVPFDPNIVFEEITFDPRLAMFERNERETVIRSFGYTGLVTHLDLYGGPIFLVVDKKQNIASS
jgi:hypothetical protein